MKRRLLYALSCLAFTAACGGYLWQCRLDDQAADAARTMCEIQGRKWDGVFYQQDERGGFIGRDGLWVGNGREVLNVDVVRRHAFYCWNGRDLP